MTFFERARPIRHDEGRFVAMPIGGIGTGGFAIGADGGLRQWQLQNVGNHRGELPGTFFALRVSQIEPPLDRTFVLQAPVEPGTPTPLVNDDLLPDWQRELLASHPGVESTTFRGLYPFAEIDYHGLPVDVRLTAVNPLIPLDVARSSLPVGMFTFTVTNPSDVDAHVWLGAAMQNPVGHDGTTPIDGVTGRGYGGNTNRVRRENGWTSLVMDNHAIDPLAPGAGQAVLAIDSASAATFPQWQHPREFLGFLDARAFYVDSSVLAPHAAEYQPSGPATAFEPSGPGRTWNGGVAAVLDLKPGETGTVRVLLAWHFPNRYANFVQFGPPNPQWGPTRFWLGNAYAQRHADAVSVAADVVSSWDSLVGDTRAWTSVLAESDLDDEAVEHLAAQAAILRSPSCFVTADGAFFGFEGVLGASTVMWTGDVGGSCPLNCTHVWNYAQAVARLFPQLERSMRQTEYDVMQAPEGYLPHRVISPTYLPQLWDKPIGGPVEPALDGMLGSVLKTYREVRNGAGLDWLQRYWPSVQRLLAYVRDRWDRSSTGVLRGVQPSTHDIDLCGVNSFMGTLWLAALRAAAEMAHLVGDSAFAVEAQELFERGSSAYDKLLFNGSYYVQVLDEGESTDYQWLHGCLADQLIGQWWAHQLDLGYLLPRDHVVSALRSVVAFNLRTGFDGFDHIYRVFADRDDTGLLMCTWPSGGRPAVPTRYCDEVWTGSEYQVAAHCLREGLDDEAYAILRGVWARYDGRRRNPYNEIECGDHYVRAMAGWSVVDALSSRPGTWPLLTPTGWGIITRSPDGVSVSCRYGVLPPA
ncbi:GH116 family glycosyl-hydrolase [Hamadaea sp. NPDC050747]|uniref:GH116 family glycosyl-hydrolase n=1 Tax=Hamadaea sp. NPDC050747 TaxID=3155789 RepID=UPI0033F91409